MDPIPQSNLLNPAIQPACNVYIGIPATNLEINAGNSAVGFSDVLTYNKEIDSMVLPIYDAKTKADFLNKLKKTNYLFSDFRMDLVSFSFRIQKTYLSFNASLRMETYTYLPKDYFKFGMNFNHSSSALATESFDLSNLGVKTQVYREFGIGISQEINEKFTFGLRAKLLFGIAAVNTSNSDIRLNNTGIYEWQTNASVNVNSSIPGLLVYDTNGKIDSTEFQDIKDAKQAYDLFGTNKNVGFGLDLGIVAQPLKNLSISASVVDLGFIRWRNNVHNVSIDGEYAYKGVKLDVGDSANLGKALLDTLKKSYDAKSGENAFTTGLSGKLYAGVYYQLAKGLGVGALTRLQLIKQSVRSEFTFSLNYHATRFAGATVSYTIGEGSYDNLGIGIYMRPLVLPLQWYFVCDRIPLTWNKNVGKGSIPYIPAYLRAVNFSTGFNLAFGCKHKPKVNKDKPLVDI
jgi:hypothetical protein